MRLIHSALRPEFCLNRRTCNARDVPWWPGFTLKSVVWVISIDREEQAQPTEELQRASTPEGESAGTLSAGQPGERLQEGTASTPLEGCRSRWPPAGGTLTRPSIGYSGKHTLVYL